jgi:hypothetical protein
MSKHLYLTESPGTRLSESHIYLEDDVLTPVWELASRSKPPMAWRLFEDLYGDADFTPESAKVLAEDCQRLADEAEPTIAIWLLTIATFAAAASVRNNHIVAAAD